MKRDNPFIGMTPEELNEYLDDLKKEKPGKDDNPIMTNYLFGRSKRQKIILPNQPEERRIGERCLACDTFYFDSEKMIDESGLCENCREGLEILEKEEKKSKAIP